MDDEFRMFYLNVVGYKGQRKIPLLQRLSLFYLNVVGYKASPKAVIVREGLAFYLNVVGYKVIVFRELYQRKVCFI